MILGLGLGVVNRHFYGLPFIVTGTVATAEPGRARFTGTGPVGDLSGVKIYRAAVGAGFGAAVAVSAVLPVAPGAAFDVIAGDAAATNLFVNGDFASGGTWTLGTGWSIASGVANHVTPTAGTLLQPVTMVAGDTYRFTVNITAYTAGGIGARIVGSTTESGTNWTAAGLSQRTVVAPLLPVTAGFNAGATAALTIDNAILVRETVLTLPMGAADYYVVPVSTIAFEGTPSGPFTLTIP